MNRVGKGRSKRDIRDFDAVAPAVHTFSWGFVRQHVIRDDQGSPTMCRCESFLLDTPDVGVQEAFDADPETCLAECVRATNEYVLERELTRKIQEFQESRDQAALQPYLKRHQKKRAIADDDPDNRALMDELE